MSNKDNGNSLSLEGFGDPGEVGSERKGHMTTRETIEGVFGELGTGMEEDDLGATRATSPIEQYQGQSGRLDIISLLTKRVLFVKTHFDLDNAHGLGRFYCLNPKSSLCCRAMGLPLLHVVIPIVKYETVSTQDGEDLSVSYKKGGRLAIQYLKISREKYEYFRKLAKAGADPTAFDYKVACEDTKFQRLVFDKMGEARWRANPKVQQAVLDKLGELVPFIRSSIARDVTEREFMEAYGLVDATVIDKQSASGISLDQLI